MVERTEGYAKVISISFDVRPGEVVIVVSNSGINPVPIELAIEAKERGAKTIAVTSAGNYAAATSRHSSGKKLADVVDLTVDSRVPVGDAILSLDGLDGAGRRLVDRARRRADECDRGADGGRASGGGQAAAGDRQHERPRRRRAERAS